MKKVLNYTENCESGRTVDNVERTIEVPLNRRDPINEMQSEQQIASFTAAIEALALEVRELKEQQKLSEKPVYNNETVLKLFGISQKTLKSWRDNGLLGYSQIGKIYQYSPQDISNFLNNTHEKYSGYHFQ